MAGRQTDDNGGRQGWEAVVGFLDCIDGEPSVVCRACKSEVETSDWAVVLAKTGATTRSGVKAKLTLCADCARMIVMAVLREGLYQIDQR